eukprot:1337962-Rhodomonas_salina.1
MPAYPGGYPRVPANGPGAVQPEFPEPERLGAPSESGTLSMTYTSSSTPGQPLEAAVGIIHAVHTQAIRMFRVPARVRVDDHHCDGARRKRPAP